MRDAYNVELARRFKGAVHAIRRALCWHDNLKYVEPGEMGYKLIWELNDACDVVVRTVDITEDEVDNSHALFVRLRITHSMLCSNCGRRFSSRGYVWCDVCYTKTVEYNPFEETDSPKEIRLLFEAILRGEIKDWEKEVRFAQILKNLKPEQLSELEPKHLLPFLQAQSHEIRLWAQTTLSQIRGPNPTLSCRKKSEQARGRK